MIAVAAVCSACRERSPRTERTQHIAHAAVVDAFSTHLSGTVRPESEHDGIHTLHRGGEGVRSGDVADDDLRFPREAARLARIAYQGTNAMALVDRLLDDEAPDATGRTDNEHGHARRAACSLHDGILSHRQWAAGG